MTNENNYCIECSTTLMECDKDPNGDENATCIRCRSQQAHDFDAEPDVMFDRFGTIYELTTDCYGRKIAIIDFQDEKIRFYDEIFEIFPDRQGFKIPLVVMYPEDASPRFLPDPAFCWLKDRLVTCGDLTTLSDLHNAAGDLAQTLSLVDRVRIYIGIGYTLSGFLEVFGSNLDEIREQWAAQDKFEHLNGW